MNHHIAHDIAREINRLAERAVCQQRRMAYSWRQCLSLCNYWLFKLRATHGWAHVGGGMEN